MVNQSLAAAEHRVTLPEHSFKLHKTSIEIKDLSELVYAIEIMSEESFNHHVTEKKNDFATWVKEVLHDDELSNKLKGIKDKKQAYIVAKQRQKELTEPKYDYRSTVLGFGLWDVLIGFVAGLVVGSLLGYFLI